MPSNPFADRYDELAIGVAFGGAALLACLVGAGWRRRRGQDPPDAGLALVAAGVLALLVLRQASVRLVAGLTLLALAGLRPPPTWSLARPLVRGVRVVLALAGSALVMLATIPAGAAVPPWPVPAVVVGLVGMAGLLVADFDRHQRPGQLILPLLVLSAAGIWATVPDVEAALPILGAVLPLALLGWPVRLAGDRAGVLGAPGALASGALLAWAVVTGGAGRGGSIVGGLAALGVLGVVPVVRRLEARHGRARGPGSEQAAAPWAMLAGQLFLVAMASWVVGRQETIARALPLAVIELGVAVALGVTARRVLTAYTSTSQ